MKVTVQTSGFKEMEDLLFLMTKATAKNTAARAMIKSLEPTKNLARLLSPKDDRELERGIEISRRATSKKKLAKSDLEIFCGPIKQIRHAIPQEFGTVKHGPNPFMRPAWDATKLTVLTRLGYLQWEEIEKSIARLERKAAREAAKIKAGK